MDMMVIIADLGVCCGVGCKWITFEMDKMVIIANFSVCGVESKWING